MPTEQQLRERAEAILAKHILLKHPGLSENEAKKLVENNRPSAAIDAMLDFHKQELQRIGEVVYGKRWKLSLSNVGEVKDLEASDNATIESNCDAPFNGNKSIEQSKPRSSCYACNECAPPKDLHEGKFHCTRCGNEWSNPSKDPMKDIEQFEKVPVMIKCPECGTVQAATIERTIPWGTYIHRCESCKYTIMESEWNEVKPFKDNKSIEQ